jgi:site-specific DNA-cytosine methylase
MIRHLSTFTGIGGASTALRQAEINFETIAISEIDSKPIAMFPFLHENVPPNLGDILKWTKRIPKFVKKVDLMTGGFPCQPFSGMGLKQGFDSPKFKAALALVTAARKLKPKYLLLENVADLLGKNFIVGFKKFMDEFRKLGYVIDISLINPKDYGYIQSRSRIYIAMSRHDMDVWTLPRTLNRVEQKFVQEQDPRDHDHFTILPHRVKMVYGEGTYKNYFGCLCARSIDAHCSRFTWIRTDNKERPGRSPTPSELFQLFGYKNPPKIICYPRKKGYLSLSKVGHCFGNSWHIGHAEQLIRTLPLAIKQQKEKAA